MKEQRNSYTAQENLTVIAYAETHGNRAASRHFTINEANLRLWRKQKTSLEAMPVKKKAKRGLRPKYEELESELLTWVRERRQAAIDISSKAKINGCALYSNFFIFQKISF